MGRTLIEKLWAEHAVADLGDGTTLLYIDRVFLHERTGSIALKGLEAAGRQVRNPEQVFCANGMPVESFAPSTDALNHVPRDVVADLRATFPDLGPKFTDYPAPRYKVRERVSYTPDFA